MSDDNTPEGAIANLIAKDLAIVWRPKVKAIIDIHLVKRGFGLQGDAVERERWRIAAALREKMPTSKRAGEIADWIQDGFPAEKS